MGCGRVRAGVGCGWIRERCLSTIGPRIGRTPPWRIGRLRLVLFYSGCLSLFDQVDAFRKGLGRKDDNLIQKGFDRILSLNAKRFLQNDIAGVYARIHVVEGYSRFV